MQGRQGTREIISTNQNAGRRHAHGTSMPYVFHSKSNAQRKVSVFVSLERISYDCEKVTVRARAVP
jgi:hypothetical protein